jgi:nitrite reductase (NADH) large subunit
VLATGSSPFVPPVAGWRAPGCFVYRTLGDLEAIRSHASAVHIGVVIGGGLLGLEAAYALERLGLRVHVVEVAPRLLHRQLDETGGALVRARVQALGITVHTGATTTAILTDDDDCTAAVRFADGNELPTDLVLFCAGVRPRDELARAAGLNMGKRGGVVIDERCRTSDPDIYAIGDCTLYCGSNYGLTAPGYEMAEVAVEDITGSGARRYRGGDPSSRLALAGVEAASFGDAFGVTEGARVISFFDGAAGIYKKLVVSGDGKSLLGGMLVGDASAYDRLHQLVRSRAVLPPHPEELVLPERSDDASGLALPTLRDAASAC